MLASPSLTARLARRIIDPAHPRPLWGDNPTQAENCPAACFAIGARTAGGRFLAERPREFGPPRPRRLDKMPAALIVAFHWECDPHPQQAVGRCEKRHAQAGKEASPLQADANETDVRPRIDLPVAVRD